MYALVKSHVRIRCRRKRKERKKCLFSPAEGVQPPLAVGAIVHKGERSTVTSSVAATAEKRKTRDIWIETAQVQYVAAVCILLMPASRGPQLFPAD